MHDTSAGRKRKSCNDEMLDEAEEEDKILEEPLELEGIYE